MSLREDMVRNEVVDEFFKVIKHCKRICLATHRNADPDAIASTLAMSELIKYVNKNCYIEYDIPEGLELASKEVILKLFDEELLNKLLSSKCVSSYDLVIILDTASKGQLSSYISELIVNNDVGYVVVDHHEINNLISNALMMFYDPEASSTSEILASLISKVSIMGKLNRKLLTLLLIGILYDTKFLRIVRKCSVFKVIHDLILNGANYSESISLLSRREIPYSERVARLRAMSRAGIYLISKGDKNYLMTITCIGAFESSVLKILQDAGADISVAICRRKEFTRVTLRASKNVLDDMGKPIAAELANFIGKELGGSGGGHASAAGVVLSSNRSNVNMIFNLIKEYFIKKGYNFRVLEEGRWLKECE